jgi:hypothetical protein
MSTDPELLLTTRLAVLQTHMGPQPASSGSSDIHRAYGRGYLASCVEYMRSGCHDRADEMMQHLANICPGLLVELDTYYQLGCGEQPKGSIGDLRSLNAQKSGLHLVDMLTRLFAQPHLSRQIKGLENAAFAQAYCVMGLLSYGAQDFPLARRFFMQAVRCQPRVILEARFLGSWLRALTTPQLVHRLKGLRRWLSNIAGHPIIAE